MEELNVNSIIGLAFLLGLMVGSFLNVLIHRLPSGESVVHPRSRCPRCRSQIRWFDNIPVLSFVLLRGRCRDCGCRIPFQYPVVELLSGMIAALVVWRFGATLEALWIYTFLAILLVITLVDWRHQIIPDVLSLGGAMIGLAGSFVCLRLDPLDSLIGALVGAGVLVVVAVLYKALRKVDGLGGGDIKLMVMIGAFLGWKMVFPVLFIASFLGSCYGLHLMRSGGNGKTAVAFGSFLAPSAALVFFLGGHLWNIYLAIYPG